MLKAKQNNLIQGSDGNFGTNYTYRGENNQKIEQFLLEGFFDTVVTRLVPADTIRIIEMQDNKVVAATLLIVISRGPEPKLELDIRPYDGSKIVRYTKTKDEEPKKEAPFIDVKYIDGTGQVERLNDGLYQVKCDGKVIYETEKKGLAMAISRGDAPIPQE